MKNSTKMFSGKIFLKIFFLILIFGEVFFSTAAKKVITCYDSWTNIPRDKLDPSLCTHILLFSGSIRTLSTIDWPPETVVKSTVGLKNKNPDLKVLISLLAGTNGPLGPITNSSELSKNIAKTIVNYLLENNADGIDIDWEWPVDDSDPNHAFSYKDLFNQFLTTLRAEMDQASPTKHLMITLAVTAYPWISMHAYSVPGLYENIDDRKIMSINPFT